MPSPKYRRQRKQVSEILEEKWDGLDPVDEMLKLAKNHDVTNRLKFDIFREVAKFVHPQRKAVQHTGDDTQPVKFNFLLGGNEEDSNE